MIFASFFSRVCVFPDVCMLFLQPSLRRKYCDLIRSSSPLVSVTSPAGRHGAPSVLFMAFWWITDPLKMSTTEVAHRGAVIPVVWVKNVAERFISSLIMFTFIKPPSVAYSDKIYRQKKKVQGLSLTDLHGCYYLRKQKNTVRAENNRRC